MKLIGQILRSSRWILPLLFTCSAFAYERPIFDLQVLEELPVYAKPDKKSAVISRLDRGDLVVISAKVYGAFRKVLVTAKSRPTAGYIPIAKIKRSQIRERSNEMEHDRQTYNSKYSLGLALVPSYMQQGAAAFQLSDGTTYDTSAFTGTSYFFSLFTDVPVGPKWGLRPYVSFRTTNFKGTATQRDAAPGATSKSVTRQQTLTGLGLVIKRYTSTTSSWWWGGGCEIAVGSKVSIKISHVPVPTSAEDKPFFLMGFLSLGGDIPAPYLKSIYLVTDLRVGMLGTNQFMTAYVESFIGLAYLF